MSKKVLIIGDDNRSFLASVRSLGRLGLEVHAAPENWASPVLSSQYIKRRISLPQHDLSPDDWIDALERVHKREGYSFILPCNEKGILPLVRARSRFSDTVLGIVGDHAFDVFFDKVKTRACAEEVGVPVAAGRTFDPQEGAGDLIAEFGLPLAIKPSRSFVDGNLFSRRSVRLAHSPGDLFDALKQMDSWDTYFVEAVFPGSGAGISVLAHEGEILQAFQHQRVHEPETGGGSSYRKSAPLHPVMMDDVEKMARATNLTGLAMFEFRHNRDTGAHILLEVNARLWGSVPLAIASGIDFPALYYKLLVEGDRGQRLDYKVPVYGRNLTNDLNSLTERAVTTLSSPTLSRARDLVTSVAGYWRYATRLDTLDSYDREDERPHRKDFQNFKSDLNTRILSKIPPLVRSASRQEVDKLEACLERVGPGMTVAVLCRGNICRSPFATYLLQDKAAHRQLDMTVVQGGTLPHSGRPSPQNACIAAGRLGIDLRAHRSCHVSALSLQDVDLILHFDPIIEQELSRVMRDVPSAVFNLGHLAPRTSAAAIIRDPVGKDVDFFMSIYQQIDIALDRFLDKAQTAWARKASAA
ncbi:MAG: ATP-grasp domain-containing protein [Pseudomonadota bacterium]